MNFFSCDTWRVNSIAILRNEARFIKFGGFFLVSFFSLGKGRRGGKKHLIFIPTKDYMAKVDNWVWNGDIVFKIQVKELFAGHKPSKEKSVER